MNPKPTPKNVTPKPVQPTKAQTRSAPAPSTMIGKAKRPTARTSSPTTSTANPSRAKVKAPAPKTTPLEAAVEEHKAKVAARRPKVRRVTNVPLPGDGPLNATPVTPSTEDALPWNDQPKTTEHMLDVPIGVEIKEHVLKNNEEFINGKEPNGHIVALTRTPTWDFYTRPEQSEILAGLDRRIKELQDYQDRALERTGKIPRAAVAFTAVEASEWYAEHGLGAMGVEPQMIVMLGIDNAVTMDAVSMSIESARDFVAKFQQVLDEAQVKQDKIESDKRFKALKTDLDKIGTEADALRAINADESKAPAPKPRKRAPKKS